MLYQGPVSPNAYYCGMWKNPYLIIYNARKVAYFHWEMQSWLLDQHNDTIYNFQINSLIPVTDKIKGELFLVGYWLCFEGTSAICGAIEKGPFLLEPGWGWLKTLELHLRSPNVPICYNHLEVGFTAYHRNTWQPPSFVNPSNTLILQ